MAESVPLENIETGEVLNHCRFFKMIVLQTHKAMQVDDVLSNSVSLDSVVFTDKSTSYLNIADFIEFHISEKSTKQTTTDTLKWVHIAISNAIRNILGIHYKINGKYLQNYLNEFVYKFNGRYFGSVFERLIVAAVYPFWAKVPNNQFLM